MKTFDVLQGSPAWFELRRGVPTASQFHRILTPKTAKLSASADEYLCELIGEQFALTPPVPVPINHAMQHGLDCEPEARRYFEMETGQDTRQVGFVTTDDGRFGGSPDFLVGDGGGELKCPQPKTQVAYLLDGGLPADYRCQVHGHLIVSGHPRWWFLSYCPGLPPLLLEVKPDEFTAALAVALEQFHVRYTQALNRVKEMV